MWRQEYSDYPKDYPLKKQQVETGKAVIGCEMHDIQGWGESFHQKKPSKNFLYRLFRKLIVNKKR